MDGGYQSNTSGDVLFRVTDKGRMLLKELDDAAWECAHHAMTGE
jgi:hypothetical protein